MVLYSQTRPTFMLCTLDRCPACVRFGPAIRRICADVQLTVLNARTDRAYIQALGADRYPSVFAYDPVTQTTRQYNGPMDPKVFAAFVSDVVGTKNPASINK